MASVTIKEAFTVGKFFEDIDVGERYLTPARTVTEADILSFAGLSGDFNAIHTDEVFCRQLGLPGRIAHGLLTLSILTGLNERVGFTEDTILAFLGMNDLSYGKYVTPGDTIHAEVEVTGKRESSKPERGIVTSQFTGVNQNGDKVLGCEMVVMIRRRQE
jgi:acyl dehydratase